MGIVNNKEHTMGYRVINVTQEFRESYTERSGLEGPFFYEGNRVLYYDPQEGRYLNPQTDHYLSYAEYCDFTGAGYSGGFVDVSHMSPAQVWRMGRED
jgi:hypothetical protein